MRLIDADAIGNPYRGTSREWDGMILLKLLEDAPTVDAVPVVRCKDCQYYWKNNPSDDVSVCLASPKDDAFCSEGERREDGDK